MDQLRPSPANSSPLTPLGFLDRAAIVYADSPSIIYGSTTYTWSQTHRRCLQLASSISSLGIGPNDVVSVLAPNVPATYELHFAVPFTGAVLNAVNTRLDSNAVSVILRHAASKLVFVDHEHASLMLNAVDSLDPRPKLVLIVDDGVASPVTVDHFVDTYEGLVMKGDPGFRWVRPGSEWDPIVLNYTSGTTSSPKGVVHCHRGAHVTSLNGLIDWSVPNRPVYLWTLPMFHSNGWGYAWGIAAVGGANVCVRRFDGADIVRLIERHGVTHMCGAPVVLSMITATKTTLKSTLNNKKPVRVMVGGAPPPEGVLVRAEAMGFEVSHGYGLTETGGVVVSCAWKQGWDRYPTTERARLKSRQGVRTAGMAEVEVLDPLSGVAVKRDGLVTGEVAVRGGCVMLGYLNDPSATSQCMKPEGWLLTGDVAVVHPDGYLEIKDRFKDVIISGGENVSSVEVEAALYSNPAVNEVAVVARPDEYWGETPCAFVSLKREFTDGKPNVKEMIEYCRSRLPHYMVPKTVVFKEELPKTSTGKIKKFELREIAKSMGLPPSSRM